jgi:putative glutamine amidotransferase
MKKLILTLAFIPLLVSLTAQDFFREDFSKEKNYLLLDNPTVDIIEVVSFLVDKGILDVDLKEVEFVGVYHSSQEYDFKKSADYIAENGLKSFHLHEVVGALPEDMLYRQNQCSDDFRRLFENSVGIIFFGGQDIPPAVYGEENWYSKTTDPGRHYFEVSLLFHLLGGTRNTTFKSFLSENPEYMVTGFCLGMQSMNVATGGTLYQDIPAQIYDKYTPETIVETDRRNLHRNYWQSIKELPDYMGANIHPVQFTDNDFFTSVIKVPAGLRPLVYSHHHQSLKNVSPCFAVTALSDDGKVVEGIAHVKYPNVFSVQFHPEVSALYEDRAKVRFTPEDELTTLHSMLDKKSLKFHKKYWGHISAVIKKNVTAAESANRKQ